MGHTGERDPSSARVRDSGVGPVHAADEGWHVAEQALENERRLRFLTDNVPTVVLYQLLIEPSGKRRFVYVSAGVEALHGLTPEQVLADASLIYQLVPGDYVVLWVRDDGTGMSPEVQSRLFEPFFTTKGVGKGTGLGLSMVYGGVKQNGGSIEVLSELGHGSEFRLYFPASQPQSESSREAPRPQLPRGKETILVVEDEQLVRTLARGILERQGYRVLSCESGAAALAAIEQLGQQKLDLLLTDLVMPGMNGQQLAEAVLALRPSVRVLFTSGYSEDAALERSVAAGRAQFLAKPYSVHDLSRRVREMLDQPS